VSVAARKSVVVHAESKVKQGASEADSAGSVVFGLGALVAAGAVVVDVGTRGGFAANGGGRIVFLNANLVPEALASVDAQEATPSAEQVLAMQEAPAVEEAVSVEGTTAAEELVAVEEIPAVDETPAVEEKPAVEGTVAIAEAPTVEDELVNVKADAVIGEKFVRFGADLKLVVLTRAQEGLASEFEAPIVEPELTKEVKAEPTAVEAIKKDRDVELSSVAPEPVTADHEEISQVVGNDQQEQSEEPEQLEEGLPEEAPEKGLPDNPTKPHIVL
jgi:hypothetical protein